MAASDTLSVVTTIDFCRNFPVEPTPKLPREQLFEVIKKTLETHRVVMLEGEPLSGKTECLADFMRRSPNTCIGVFLNSDLGIFHSPNYMRVVVAEQASWIVDGTPLTDDVVTEERYSQLLYRLQRHAKNKRITWLIDGLCAGRPEESRDVAELVELIPFGMREFNFVVAGERDLTALINLRDQKPKSVPLFNLALEEAISYFADLGLKAADVQEIRQFSAGIIGRMQKFRDFMSYGISFDSLLQERNPSLETLFEFEWKQIPQSDQMRSLLAYVVFSNKPVSISELAKYLQVDEAGVHLLLASCRILAVSPGLKMVSIESRAQRSFVKSRVADLQNYVRSYVITSLLEKPTSKEATMYLPSQLMDAGRHDELLKHLGPNHFLNLLETERSLHSIKRHADLGIDAARALHNSTAEMSLSLIRSTATGLTFSIGSDSQIEALVKLGSPESALELASMAPTNEERLHLLAIAANALHTNHQPIPDDLKDQIQLLQSEVSFEDLGELGVEIACNLLPVDFDVATEITSRVLEGARKRIQNKSDVVAGDLRGSPIGDRGDAAFPGGTKSFELIPENQARRFGDAIASTVHKFSSERITAFIKSIEPSNKITVLARWLGQNREHADAYKIADLALDLVLSEVSRAPRLQDLREVAEILPYIKQDAQRDSLTRRIEAQIGLLAHQGTSAEFCRLRLLLYRVRFPKDQSNVELSLIELFGEIEAIEEISVRTTCWTWMLFQLTCFENADKLERDTSLISEVTTKLSRAIEDLLQCTANHYLAATAAISALAQTNPDRAFELVGRLNTEESRDKGYDELIRSLARVNVDDNSLRVLNSSVHRISADQVRTRAVLWILRSLVRRMDTQTFPPLSARLGELWTSIRVSSGRLQALVLTYRLRLRENREPIDIDEMAQELTSAWEYILDDTVKVELGYWIASELAGDAPAAARGWIRRSIEYAKERHIPSDTVLNALVTTVSLAVRVFPYVDDSTGDSYRRVTSLIQSIPSCELQLRLWTMLGIRLHYAGKSPAAKCVVNEFVEPILNSSYVNNELVLDSMAAEAAPLLYLVHPATATQVINRIGSDGYRDRARTNICDVLMRRCPIGEPFEAPDDHAYQLDNATVADILGVLREIEKDSLVFSVVEDLCASIGSDKNKSRIPRSAAVDYLDSLTKIVDKSLPDRKNIQHNGFLIACNAHILRARCVMPKSSVRKEDWLSLYSVARAIDNIADRVVVTAIVGSCAVAAKTRDAMGDWVSDVRRDLAAIPSDQDRVDRYDWIARIVKSVDRVACRSLLTDAMKRVVQLPETDDLVKRQRSLLDLASAIDPRLADQLIELNDTDDARKIRLKKEKAKQDNRLALAKDPAAEELSNMTDQELTDVCRDNLGRLEAGRIGVRAIEEFDALQRRASTMPIELASNIWHFIAENALRKRSRDKHDNFATKLFDSTCKSSEIVCGLIGKFFSGEQRNRTLDIGLVRNGDRELFLERLREWAMLHDDEVIRISDPYFGPEDLEVVKTISLHAPNARFRILTSREHVRKKGLPDVAEAFEDSWRQLSDDSMPEIELAVVGIGSEGKHPIHDRWIVCNSGGLRLGTSAHSMGYMRTSEVSDMNSPESLPVCDEVDLFMDKAPREINGERVVVAKYLL